MSETMSVSSVEENVEALQSSVMEGEDVSYDLSQTTVRTKQPTLVDVAESHLSEEEEEEIFHEATEPSVPGHEVVVDLAAADVRRRPHTMVVALASETEVGQVSAGPEEFVSERPTEEEIPVALIDAKKEAPKMSLVKLQEHLLEPAKVGELKVEDVQKEFVTNESLTQVQFLKLVLNRLRIVIKL